MSTAIVVKEKKMTFSKWLRVLAWRHAVALLAIAFALFPLIWMASASFDQLGKINTQSLIPQYRGLDNYRMLWENPDQPYWRWMRNSVMISSINAVLQLAIGATAGSQNQGQAAIMDYIQKQFEGIDVNYQDVIIAYEPVWAIGTGLTPSTEEILAIHTALRAQTKAPLLYGGSVKVDNAGSIMALNNVDGILVGSAALSAHDFCDMIAQAAELNLEKGE